MAQTLYHGLTAQQASRLELQLERFYLRPNKPQCCGEITEDRVIAAAEQTQDQFWMNTLRFVQDYSKSHERTGSR